MGKYHDEIAEDLACAIGPTPFLGVPLGSVWLGRWQGNESPGLADVVTVKPSYRRFCLSVFEVKVSRADFLSDIRSEKWKRYLPHCHRFYFATLPDVAIKGDIPPDAGWIVKGPNSWSYKKAAPVREIEIPEFTLLSMLFAKQRNRRERNLKKVDYAKRYAEPYGDIGEAAKIFGKKVAKAYAGQLDVEKKQRWLDCKLDMMEQYLEKMRVAIQGGLGLKVDGEYLSLWEVSKKLEELKAEAMKELEGRT